MTDPGKVPAEILLSKSNYFEGQKPRLGKTCHGSAGDAGIG